MKEQLDRDQDLPCQGLAAAPGRQRTPASRAWSWPRCGPATGVLGALRAMGRLLKETRTLQAVGEAHVSLFTHALPADSLCEGPRPTDETVLARESPISPKWALTGVVEGSACLVQLSPLATHSRDCMPAGLKGLPGQALLDSRPQGASGPAELSDHH